jgi:hypothetical protein
MEFFWQPVGKHNFPPDGKKAVYCPNITSEGEMECPVCEIVDGFWKAGDKASKKMAGELKARKSFWMNVIDRSDEEKGPQIFTPGVIIFGSLISIFNDPDYGDFTDVDEGFDISIERTGTGRETEYEVRPKPRKSPLHADSDKIDELLEKAKDLSVVEVSDDPEEDKELSEGHALYLLPYDRIVREFDLDDPEAIGTDIEDDVDEDEEDEDEPPAKKEIARRRVARRAVRK